VTGRRFFARWLARSLRANATTSGVGTLSLAVSAALVFTVSAVSSGIEGQLGRELRGYGANAVLVPRLAPLRFGVGTLDVGDVSEEGTLSVADLARLPASLVETVAPGLALRAEAAGREVAATGYDLPALRRLNPLWRVAPRWPEGGREVLLGATLAARLRLAPGATLDVRVGGRSAAVAVAGVVETGGPEDESLVLPLALAQELAGRPGRASLALARVAVAERDADAAARLVEAELPGAEARTVQQVARAEAALLRKVRRLLVLVAAAVAAAAAFTVSGTLGVLLAARRHELGLCLALGATPGRLRALLLAEAAVSGLAGGAAGCLLGAAAAEAIARGVFGAFVPIGAGAPALALAAALAVAVGASVWPVRRAVRISPCDTLRAA
jgi:putative ABC transport system permease protein